MVDGYSSTLRIWQAERRGINKKEKVSPEAGKQVSLI